jgi:phosphatidylserine/phosphatidylglycerophosphate/cardiolipin synthase-like enzyme
LTLSALLASCERAQSVAVPAAARPEPPGALAVDVYFSPNGGATDAIVRELAAARRSVRVQAYSFTSAPIAGALVDAKRRGVDVLALLDDSNQTDRYSSATFLHNNAVPVLIDAAHAIAHNKVILIDGATVITGSFNFSKAAEERNAENLLVIRDRDLAGKYLANFERHRQHAKAYAPPPAR